MGRVQEGVRRTTESRARGEGTREERLFDMSVSEVKKKVCVNPWLCLTGKYHLHCLVLIKYCFHTLARENSFFKLAFWRRPTLLNFLGSVRFMSVWWTVQQPATDRLYSPQLPFLYSLAESSLSRLCLDATRPLSDLTCWWTEQEELKIRRKHYWFASHKKIQRMAFN